MDDTLIAFGSEIKALEETADSFKFGGYLVVFGSQDISPLKDQFLKSTDFDIEDGDRRSVYYNHGLDGTLKKTKLGSARLFIKDAGVWLEGEIAKRDDYLKAHSEKIVEGIKKGIFGLSSGAPAHLVERKSDGGGHIVEMWPIAEASITPVPAEPLTNCVSLKSLQTVEEIEGTENLDMGDALKFQPGGSGHWVTVNGHHVFISEREVNSDDVYAAGVAHDLSPEAHKQIEQAHADGKITTNTHLHRTIAHAEQLKEKQHLSTSEAYSRAVAKHGKGGTHDKLAAENHSGEGLSEHEIAEGDHYLYGITHADEIARSYASEMAAASKEVAQIRRDKRDHFLSHGQDIVDYVSNNATTHEEAQRLAKDLGYRSTTWDDQRNVHRREKVAKTRRRMGALMTRLAVQQAAGKSLDEFMQMLEGMEPEMKIALQHSLFHTGLWDENAHPRDDAGRFSSGGGGGVAHSLAKWKADKQKEVDEAHINGDLAKVEAMRVNHGVRPSDEAREKRKAATANASTESAGGVKETAASKHGLIVGGLVMRRDGSDVRIGRLESVSESGAARVAWKESRRIGSETQEHHSTIHASRLLPHDETIIAKRKERHAERRDRYLFATSEEEANSIANEEKAKGRDVEIAKASPAAVGFTHRVTSRHPGQYGIRPSDEAKEKRRAATSAPKAKEPYEMTIDEFHAARSPEMGSNRQIAEEMHRVMVRAALIEGKPIPDRVLSEHPDLKLQKETPLQGSDKQIIWANDVRSTFVQWWNKPETQQYLRDTMPNSHEQMKPVVADILKENSARYWLDNHRGDPVQAIKDYFKKHKSRYQKSIDLDSGSSTLDINFLDYIPALKSGHVELRLSDHPTLPLAAVEGLKNRLGGISPEFKMSAETSDSIESAFAQLESYVDWYKAWKQERESSVNDGDDLQEVIEALEIEFAVNEARRKAQELGVPV